MSQEVVLSPVRLDEVALLTAIQTRCFDIENQRHLSREKGGPEGYDSREWAEAMVREGRYLGVRVGEELVGGLVVKRIDEKTIRLNRLFIAQEWQGKGVGKKAMELLEMRYPEIERWVLDTPEWAIRNQHFYSRLGFVKIDEIYEPSEDFNLFIFEKTKEGENVR